MPTSRLTLSLRQWYGLELLGPLAGMEDRADTWTAATPIFLTGVRPLKTGDSMVEVVFVRVVAALQPTLTTLTLKVLHRGERAIIATGEGWRGVDDLFAITTIDMDWLRRLCPRLVDRYVNHAWWWYGGNSPTDPRKYLEHVFGVVPEQISQQWTAEDAPWPELTIRQPRAFMAYRREWSGMDAWLILRPEIPDSMDDKWIVRAVDRGPVSLLSFRRSWTGYPWYELTLQKTGDKLTADNATVSLNERQRGFGTPEQEQAVLDWLIDHYLLGRRREVGKLFEFADAVEARKAWATHQRAAGLPEPIWSAARRAPTSRHDTQNGSSTAPPHPEWTDYGIEDTPLGPRLGSYPLHTSAWREAFLDRLGEVGYDVLLEATSRVWALLERPKKVRATAIGLATGVGGTGKKAIWNTLDRFIEEYVGTYSLEPAAIDPPSDVDAVHQAFTAKWAAEAELRARVVKRYAALLGGEAPEMTPVGAPIGKIIVGPWLATCDAPAGLPEKRE